MDDGFAELKALLQQNRGPCRENSPPPNNENRGAPHRDDFIVPPRWEQSFKVEVIPEFYGNKFVDDYYDEFTSAYARSGFREDESLPISRIVNDLEPHIKKGVMVFDPHTLVDAQYKAKYLEQWIPGLKYGGSSFVEKPTEVDKPSATEIVEGKQNITFDGNCRSILNYRAKKWGSGHLSEPSGIAEVGNGRLLIADTNNSVIRYLDLNNGEAELLTLELKGVKPPSPKSKSVKRLRRRSNDGQIISIDGGSSKEGNLYLKISVPEGYHFSKEALSKFNVEIEPENAVGVQPLDGNLSPEGSAFLHFKRSSSIPAMGRINCKAYYCKEDEVCLYQSLSFEVQFREESENSIPAEIILPFVVKPKISTGGLQLSAAQ
ncbi:Suppressor of quenching 1 protein [Thalictrum thalictroides]|uniref:Suppressor of quenching 1 protein n=1 Tax=Thalictrum thalictroides TaxID=46969 RepID=A0A7J6W916_THATH|nr:Suppressor of quenching 1 protein [Thalictrum thalictroides]